MTSPRSSQSGLAVVLGTLLCLGLASCSKPAASNTYQGYIEGEFVYAASPLGGTLVSLKVSRGQQAAAGQPLFELEQDFEQHARQEAAERLRQSQAKLENLRKGMRPSEIESIEASLAKAEAAARWSKLELKRRDELLRANVISQAELDEARSAHDQNMAQINQIRADIKTAQLGSRDDEIRAGEADVASQRALLAQLEWKCTQKKQAAPIAALVYDTLYRQGEYVPAGSPVVSLLPPANVKARFFASENQAGSLKTGQPITVTFDGAPQPFQGRITYISPQAEFTPPVIYSRESRQKLVFMIEASFDPETGAKLHPGQPIDVRVEH
ncbi:MAG: HlyD family efflux transporter periplasmic adaptor subunit [Verrucomicrobiae bacterium]|nr:HlyD family efflux transporter periplasmic adaptor subunit [Verrucomicrobiae bacterium]